jgi:IclR family transcriptional regulator, pca regulon regulatory protein
MPRRRSDPNFMLSLARGLAVIRAFEHTDTALSVAEVARRASMSRAAARRCLYTLERLGYASGADGVFELKPKVLMLGNAYLGSASVARAAQPVLEAVSERLQESCSLSVLDGVEIVYVARAAMRRILSIGISVGTRLPSYCTSMGRVLLAFLDDKEQESVLSRIDLIAHTPRTITNLDALRTELRRVRAAGFALVDQELEIGLRSIAVPVRGRGSVVAAINVGVHAARVDLRTMTRQYVPVLREAAEEIGVAIGFSSSIGDRRSSRRSTMDD